MNTELAVVVTRLLKFRQQCLAVCSQFPDVSNKRQCLHHRRPTLIYHRQEYTRQFSKTSMRPMAVRKYAPLKRHEKSLKPRIKIPIVKIYKDMTVGKLCKELNKSHDELFEILMSIHTNALYLDSNAMISDMNVMKNAVEIAGYNYEIVSSGKNKIELDDVKQPPPNPKQLVKRSPVVTIMGHVDHGKTTLLDYLRNANVVDQEFGGITQHIGAFSVKMGTGENITFLDTPGHAAFSAMRARGAQVTDIIVLVVAGDDGVMEQTVESINHARSSGVPIIVAVNKMDKHNFDLERTKKNLLEQEIIVEELGGDIQVVPISALQGTNIDKLQEAIMALAEILDLKCDPHGLVEGRIIESKTSKKGKVATALLQRGTLKIGKFLVAGTSYAKVRSMVDEFGKQFKEVPPSIPVEIDGWKSLPSAGEEILEMETEKKAKEVVEYRLRKNLDIKGKEDLSVINMKKMQHDQKHQTILAETKAKGAYKIRRYQSREEAVVESYEGPKVSLVLKGDVDGTLQTILDLLATYQCTKCRLDIVHKGLGDVTELDVERASDFNGIVYGFNVTVPPAVQSLANQLSVTLSVHHVIYKLFDDLLERLNESLPIIKEEEIIGEATVKKVFQLKIGNKKAKIAGCYCFTGTIVKDKPVKVIRNGQEVYRGQIQTLRYFEDDVQTIKADKECGICLNDITVRIKANDIIQCYNEVEQKQQIDWNPGF